MDRKQSAEIEKVFSISVTDKVAGGSSPVPVLMPAAV
jgi:hypothetical protein